MGGCLSSESPIAEQKPSANVVSVDGELRQFLLPITVSEVLRSLTSAPDSLFLCNSDRLYFNDYIPSLHPDAELEPAQIYFVLPAAKLQQRLAASDMGALVVRFSSAFEQINASNRRRKSKTRISPVFVSEEDPQSNHTVSYRKISADGYRSMAPPGGARKSIEIEFYEEANEIFFPASKIGRSILQDEA